MLAGGFHDTKPADAATQELADKFKKACEEKHGTTYAEWKATSF